MEGLITPNLNFPVGTGFELSKPNLRVWRLQGSIRVTDLVNAAFRNQVVREFSLRIEGKSSLAEEVLRHILMARSYGEALTTVSQFALENSIPLDQKEIHSEKVEPLRGFSPLHIVGTHVRVEVTRTGFLIEELKLNPRKVKGLARDVNVFHRWVSRNLEMVRTLTMDAFLSWLLALEIRSSDGNSWDRGYTPTL